MSTSAEPSSSSSKKPSEDAAKALNHLIQGKRHMLVADYASAVTSLQTATEILASEYGEMANECGEAYFYYGKALLELARLETGVLGNALDGVPEDEEDDDESKDSEENEDSDNQVENPNKLSAEEKEKIKHDVGEAIDENSRDLDAKVVQWKANELDKFKQSGNVQQDSVESDLQNGKMVELTNDHSGNKPEGDDDEEDEDEEDAEQKELQIEKSPEANENEENGEADEEEKEDKEEEVTNLQLAWEVIELAKFIFEKQSKDNATFKLLTSDAFLKLGEIAIESGNYKQAIDDLNACLNIQKEELQADDRRIAETNYQLGLAFSFDAEFKKGIASFECALDLIKSRITNLEGQLQAEQNPDEKDKMEREIKDLTDIIPEIKSKIEDTEDMKKNAAKAQADAIKEALAQQKVMAGDDGAPMPSSSSSSATSFNSAPAAFAESPVKSNSLNGSPSKPVTNINHLVRKKRNCSPQRKADDSSSHSQLKKICSTDAGDSSNSNDQTKSNDDTSKEPVEAKN